MQATELLTVAVARRAAQDQLSFFNQMMAAKKATQQTGQPLAQSSQAKAPAERIRNK